MYSYFSLVRIFIITLSFSCLQACATFVDPLCRQLSNVSAENALYKFLNLKCDAAMGSKPAQLALGILYETGDGVPQDYKRAAHLYRQAATTMPAVTYVYSPPVGRENMGRVIPVSNGRGTPGLPEAARRLANLENSGVLK